MSERPKIVVITPVRNEEWILDRFLAVTSRFADQIIIADQCSTDASRDICLKYPKVTLIVNESENYDEASRQNLLIQKARELVPGPRIILALDADEIVAANAMEASGWQEMLEARPGTVLYFEKPDLYMTTDQCIRYDTPWPIGYVDDGAKHQPRKIHSIRVPVPNGAPELHVRDVKVLHYGMVRLNAQESKVRMYCVVENTLGTMSFWRRRIAYEPNRDWTKLGRLEASLPEWFAGWERDGIDMRTIRPQTYYWTDFEVLKHFAQYGARRYWFDDIWEFNWEGCHACLPSYGSANGNIARPPKMLTLSLRMWDKSLQYLKSLRRY